MSFGLTNAPAASMDLMNRVFKQYLDMFIIVFIDDILVYSRSKNDHVYHLIIVLQTFRAHQLFAKFIKCKFWLRSVALLGHIIFGDSIRADPQKTKAVKNWPKPIYPSDIKSFLGLNSLESSLVSEVKGKKNMDSSLVRLKESVKDQKVEVFSQGGDGATNMYRDMWDIYWWSGTNRYIVEFVAKCSNCQQVKVKPQKPSVTIQEFSIPIWKWKEVNMDFVTVEILHMLFTILFSAHNRYQLMGYLVLSRDSKHRVVSRIVSVITSSEDNEDGYHDRALGGNPLSTHVTHGAGTSKLTATKKIAMIENLKEHVFRLEETMKDIVDFMKQERLRRAEKEKQNMKKEDTVRTICNDNDNKEVLLEVEALKKASINADEVIIPDELTIVEKENLDQGNQEKEEQQNEKVVCEEEIKGNELAIVEKDNHDESKQEKKSRRKK
ncbi:hypothetical protein FXO38_19723 [Capsicum annuum]|nr:hypothetical protein FXO38_19723 [Capsicum annuum]